MVSTQTMMITGAAGALGSALAHAAAERGLQVVLLDRDKAGLERVYDGIAGAGLREPVMQQIDLAGAGPEDYEQLLQAVDTDLGGLQVLVHCAAHFDCLSPLEHVPPQEWLLTMQVNVNAAWLLSAQALPLLRRSGGQLLFLLDDLDRLSGALWGPYGVSKHAIRTLVTQFAEECSSSGVRVLGIDPGPMQSALRARAYIAEDPSELPPASRAAARIMDIVEGAVEPAGSCSKLFPQ